MTESITRTLSAAFMCLLLVSCWPAGVMVHPVDDGLIVEFSYRV